MTSQLRRIFGCENSNRVADVVFIHGLMGHPITTWHPKEKSDDDPDPNAFLPYWLGVKNQNLGIWSFGYDARAFQDKEKGDTLPTYSIANNLFALLESNKIIQISRPLVFITYSYGGIVVKNLIRNHHTSIITRPLGVVFVAVPHTSNSLNNVVKSLEILDRNRYLPQWVGKLTKIVQELGNDTGGLTELDDVYGRIVTNSSFVVKHKVYCETDPMNIGLKQKSKIVDMNDACPKITGLQAIEIKGTDHQSIAKPQDITSPIVEYISAFIEEVINSDPNAPVSSGDSPQDIRSQPSNAQISDTNLSTNPMNQTSFDFPESCPQEIIDNIEDFEEDKLIAYFKINRRSFTGRTSIKIIVIYNWLKSRSRLAELPSAFEEVIDRSDLIKHLKKNNP